MSIGSKKVSRRAGAILATCLAALAPGHAEAAKKYTIDNVAFLAGCWQGDAGGATIRETYTSPQAGSMLGNSQMASNGKTEFFEFIRLVQTADGVEYRPLPNAKTAAAFTLVKASANEVVFENAANDFPQRIVYAFDAGKGTLTARIAMLDGSKAESFAMRAVSCGGETHNKALRR